MTIYSTNDLAEIAKDHSLRTEEEWDALSPHPVRPDPLEGTVAIIGKGWDHVLVPWGEEGREYWGLNDQPADPMYAPVSCYTRWFQLHPPRYLQVHYPKGITDLFTHWGAEVGMPLYMDKHYDYIPDSVPYPKEEVEALTLYGDYHVSSFDWMVALAILEGWETIELYGTDFFTFPTILNGEPVAARPCLEYWLGVAEGRGINVVVHQRGDMFKNIHVAVHRSSLQYGFEHEPALDLTLDSKHWRDVR